MQNGHEYSHLYKGFYECTRLSTSDRRTPAVCLVTRLERVTSFLRKGLRSKKDEERQEVQRLISYISTHNVEKILVWELSRLGRNTLEFLNTIENLTPWAFRYSSKTTILKP